ncbi:MAG: DUF4249 domain-containing protein [Bacteroides sp.]|nr:DUF4249 domain-containing protein [Bacteroides sp.]
MKHLIIHIAIISLSFTSCEREIDIIPDAQESMLIMNAQLLAESNENVVYLHLSEGNHIGTLSEGTLTLYVNGEAVESPTALLPTDIIPRKDNQTPSTYEWLLKDINYKKFRLTTVLHPGDQVRLEATAENGKYHAEAETVVPNPVNPIQVDTCSVQIRQFGSMRRYRRLLITLQDRPNEKNYYRLEVSNTFRAHSEYYAICYDQDGNPLTDEEGFYVTTLKDTIVDYTSYDLINREDIILTDGHTATDQDEENALVPYIDNQYNIFTDARFTDYSTTLKVYNDLILPEYTYTDYEGDYRPLRITVRILSLTENYYRYLQALNCLDDDDYNDTLMEPISLPNNVENGLGFVTVSAYTEVCLQLAEE